MEYELYHYGVKGMKWGVRRYQDEYGRLTAEGKQRMKDMRINKKIDDYIKSGKARVEKLAHYEVGALTGFRTPKGEEYVSGLINPHDFDWRERTFADGREYSPAELIQKSYGNPDVENPYEYTDEKSVAEHGVGRISDYDMKWCNYGFGMEGTTQNCSKCSANLELRMRGYDVGSGRQTYPSSVDSHSLWFKDAQRVDYEYDVAESALTSYGPMTSGSLSFRYSGNRGGHAVHWTVDSNGAFEIQDGQNGRRFGSLSEMMDTYGGDTSGGICTFRLDNCEPNFDAMSQDSVIRGRYLRNNNTGSSAATWRDTHR